MGRSPCCDKTQVKRGSWSPQEDETLKNFLQNHGTAGNWITLPQKAGLKRCGKSCRLRWLNYLRPDIKHGAFTIEEDDIICNLYSKMGSRWSVIASHLPGRTDNDVKNHWNTKLKKKLMTIKAIPANKDKDNNAAKNTAFDDPKFSAFLIQTSPTIIPFPEGTFGFGSVSQFSYSGSLQPQKNAKVSDQSSSFAKKEYITTAEWSDNYGGGSNQIEGFPLMDVMGTANSSEIITTGLIWPQEPTVLEALPSSSYSPICLAFPTLY